MFPTGDNKTMRQKRNLKTIAGISIVFMIVCVGLSTSCAAAPTTLEITAVKGGFGTVSVTVKNTGTVTAENITMTISVKGGILGRINITKICSGCGNCSNSILPNATKTESTAEAGRILGFGPVTILATAEASNAARVNATYSGFVLGFLVIVTK